MTRLQTRRGFIRRGAAGLAVWSGGAWLLRAGAEPTAASGDLGDYGAYLQAEPKPVAQVERTEFAPTEDNILGPFYREGAPYRAKVTPPLEEGTVLVVAGKVWGHDTRRPLANAVVDIWQANHAGMYSEHRGGRGEPGEYKYRARIITDEAGYYEYETIHPGRYEVGRDVWRPSHVHYMVRHPGYRTLVTQLYFKGDPMNAKDQFIKKSLIIELQQRRSSRGAEYEAGTFDVVLAKA